MKHFNHLFSALLLMVVLTTASCSGDFEEHPLSQAHALAPTSLIQTLDSINNSDEKKRQMVLQPHCTVQTIGKKN